MHISKKINEDILQELMLISDLYQNDILVLCHSLFFLPFSELVFISIQGQMTGACLFAAAN